MSSGYVPGNNIIQYAPCHYRPTMPLPLLANASPLVHRNHARTAADTRHNRTNIVSTTFLCYIFHGKHAHLTIYFTFIRKYFLRIS